MFSSTELRLVVRLCLFAAKPTTLAYITVYKLIKIIMECIVLIGFLECNNRCSCRLHPFGRGNSFVLNWDDWGICLRVHLHTTKVANELDCCIISSNGSDDCRVGFTAMEYATRDN
jgi:hypothetical protein